MKNQGQVFTFDMLLALIIGMLIISSSSLALSIADRRASNYLSRHSLERAARDAAGFLAKSPGKPANWEQAPEGVEVPGIAKISDNLNNPVPNAADMEKIGQLARMTSDDYWDPSKPEVQAIKDLFGGTGKFEVKIIRKENVLWNFWPRWTAKKTSGAENSLEVATSSRLIHTSTGEIRSDPIIKLAPDNNTEVCEENFLLYDGELESLDWYVVAKTSDREENRPENIEIEVEDGNQYFWNIPQTGNQTEKSFPDSHGGIENDSPTPPPQIGDNPFRVQIWQNQEDNNSSQWAQIFIIGMPECSQPKKAVQALEEKPARMIVKVWR